MDAPPVQYARTSDGVSIAYFSLGEGPTVVFASNIYGEAFFYRRGWLYVKRIVDLLLEGGFRVVLYDVRGMGASQRPVERLDLDGRVADLEAVVEVLNLRRFILAASDLAGVTAIAYAARHRDAVSRLLLVEPWASGAKKFASPAQRLARTMMAEPGDEWTVWTNVLASIVTGFRDHQLGQQLADAMQESTSPAQLTSYLRATEQIDVVDLLPNVSAPTLVAHYKDSAIGSLEFSREVASGLPRAQLLVTEARSSGPAILGFLRQDIGEEETESGRGGLSLRELEVLRLLAAGRSNQQIADELVISLNTVRRHVSNVFDKTGAANRTEASVYARDHGLD